MAPKRAELAVVVALFLLLLTVHRSPEITAAVQKGFVLDIDSPSIPFEESSFNDSKTSEGYDYENGGGNVTYWVSMPRNSTVSAVRLNATGSIVPIYTNQTPAISNGLQGFSIGNCTPDADNEISSGTRESDGIVRLFHGTNGSLVWESAVSSNKQIYSTDIGNVTPDAGSEVVAGSEDTYVYLLDSSGGEVWNYSTGGIVRAVMIGDVYDDGAVFVVAGAGSTVYLINSSGGLNWSTSLGNAVNDISIGNITTDPGNEIVAACTSGNMYIVNSSGSEINNTVIGASALNSVDVGNVTAEPGNEIAIGSADNKAYMLNSSYSQIWNFTTQGSINSISIGDVTTEYAGNEVVCGSNDKKVYTLDAAGSVIWDFEAEDYINTIAIGDITPDGEKEIAAGSANGIVYAFNFDYFPTNLSVDVGANGTGDWNEYPGALRNTTAVTGLEAPIQYHLENSCTGNLCNISLLFHSDHAGRLNISDLNVTYQYDINSTVSYENLTSTWSRTWNIRVNESVGYAVRNVSFPKSPERDIEVKHIKIPGSATSCDFNGTSCQTAAVGPDNTCNVPDFTVPESGPLPEPFHLWDDTMASDMPVRGNESEYSYTNETDNLLSSKDINIWNESGTVFYNITANTTIDDSSVRGAYFLNVTWAGQECNITPQSDDSSCDSASPGYTAFACGPDTFYACRKGSYFGWVQPYSDSNAVYRAGGATNLPANLSSLGVTLNESVWGDWSNYSVSVDDTDGDNVSVTLWYWLESTGSWTPGSTVNITGSGTAWFNVSSTNDWVGVNIYRFRYQDFNSSGWPMHSPRNTSVYCGPLVKKHSTEIVYVSGNESSVNRSESVELVVRINDTDNGTWVQENVNCSLWVTVNGSVFDAGRSNSTNLSGHCVFHFNPDGNYSAGNQTWRVGVWSDTYYNESNSSDFLVTINGVVNISLTVPADGGVMYRNSSNPIEAELVDQYGTGVNQSGFNCSFWFNYTYMGSNDTMSDGHCHLYWHPQCGYSRQDYVLNVTLTEPNGSYSILSGMDWTNVSLQDELNVTITEPQEYSLFHRGDDAAFNSSVNDSCGLCGPGDYYVNWSARWKERIEFHVNKTPGYDERAFPVIVNASYLESRGIEIGDWEINHTRVLLDGIEVPSRINAWNDSSRAAINWSQRYLNGDSELAFLATQSGWENLTYEVVYNRSDAQEGFGYLENGGFESGAVSPWECFGDSCGQDRYCQCEIRQDGEEVNGSHSVYLSSDDTGGSPHVMGVHISAGWPLGWDRIKVRYKPTGEFGSGSYIRLYAGSGMCELENTTGSWLEGVCYNTSFSSAKWVNITVHDTGNGGDENDASHVFVDYVCLANSSEDCVNYHSGYPHPVSILSESPLNHTGNITWQIALNESLGLRMVIANASGGYYKHEVENLYVYVYGWSSLGPGNISSTNCTYSDTWICRQNASMDVSCYVFDSNTSEPVEGQNVSFWGDGAYIGSNETDASGMSLINWVNSSDAEGNHTIACNITDGPAIFYNATWNNSAETGFNISSGTTTAEIDVSITPDSPADSLTRDFNHTYYLDINITNTGPIESMYDVIVEINASVTSEGIFAGPVSCPPMQAAESCNRTSVVNVTYLATAGFNDIHVNVTWVNSDASQGNVSNATGIDVENNTVLDVVECEVNYTVPVGGSFLVGNFTVISFGNTDLLTITFSESGENASNISEWAGYTPASPIAIIQHMGEQLVNITVNVPENATVGLYTANITANATGSECTPAGLCWDGLVLNLNVTRPDWMVTETQLYKTIGRSPEPMNGTIGEIHVINNKDVNWTFNVSVEGNGTGNITVSASEFNLTASSSFTIEVYHNGTGEYAEGLFLANISIANNEDAVPLCINTTAFLNVINFSINVILPNQSIPATDIMPGDILNMTANATMSGSPVDENITWYARVGSVECGDVQGFYNLSDFLWHINCSAPELPGNPIKNTLNLTGYYETEDVSFPMEKADAVIYRDVTPPQIVGVRVVNADVDGEGNLQYSGSRSEVLIESDITDNSGTVNSSWAEVYYEGVLRNASGMYNISDTWKFNFSSSLKEGDYRIVVFANDSAGKEANTSSSLLGYFDIYYPISLNGTLEDRDGVAIASDFTFYRNGTLWEIHNFSTNGTGGYNHTLHKRVYDMRVVFSGNEILFYGVDANASAVSQWGLDDPDNLTNPITIDMFYRGSGDMSNVYLPSGQPENPVIIEVIGIESNLSRTSNTNLFSLNYTGMTGGVTEARFKVFRCSEWNISTRTCGDGDDAFGELIGSEVDVANDRIGFSTTGTSAYAVAEWWEESDDGNDDDDGNDGGSSGSSSTSVASTVTDTLPFAVTTSIGNIRIHPGENKTYLLSVRNKAGGNLSVSLDVQGLEDFIFPEDELLEIGYGENGTTRINVSVPDNMGTGTYTGSIVVSAAGKSQEIPVIMTVSVWAKDLISLSIDVLTPNVNPGSKLRFEVDITNLALPPGFDVELVYAIRESESERMVSELVEDIFLEDSLVFTKSIEIGESNPVGQYYLEIWAYFSDDKSVNDVVVFNLVRPYWSSYEGRIILLILAVLGTGVVVYYGWRFYKKWRLEKARYVFPLDYRKMPQEGGDSFWIGRVADTDRKAWFNPADLTTHAIVAGATGAGKSVGASVFVEEALDKNIPVVVFDPTAQWTGFVKALEDKNLVKYYSMFGMDPKSARPFKGMIFEVTDPQDLLFDLKKNLGKFLTPGEITVFSLDKLKPGQYDEAVSIIIDALFGIKWEESTTLRLVVVFDEVHRLLEKYGGKGGYVSLEKAAREFRKWGIGIIMCSQVLADFKEAIAGNVLTEVQLNTKSITDIQKVETKYGGEYARKISRQGVGVGMIQNPKYNDGRPYFVNFRPTYHNPHKISNKDMELYKDFAKRLEKIEAKIEQLKRAGTDTFDNELELKLASDKLKQGRFRMAQIYITSLEQHLGKG